MVFYIRSRLYNNPIREFVPELFCNFHCSNNRIIDMVQQFEFTEELGRSDPRHHGTAGRPFPTISIQNLGTAGRPFPTKTIRGYGTAGRPFPTTCHPNITGRRIASAPVGIGLLPDPPTRNGREAVPYKNDPKSRNGREAVPYKNDPKSRNGREAVPYNLDPKSRNGREAVPYKNDPRLRNGQRPFPTTCHPNITGRRITSAPIGIGLLPDPRFFQSSGPRIKSAGNRPALHRATAPPVRSALFSQDWPKCTGKCPATLRCCARCGRKSFSARCAPRCHGHERIWW